tara:strand:+ start:1680 stop:2057 length:378 start_codon:yes stop_codon:yes gene_type:complete
MKLTEYLNSINYEKNNIFLNDPELAEKNYLPYVINRCLSYFTDTILHANQMNMHSDLSGKMQYDYYMETIRKRKRFSKWIKNEITDDLQLVMDEFKCSAPKAKNILPLLSDEYISHLKDLNVQKT